MRRDHLQRLGAATKPDELVPVDGRYQDPGGRLSRMLVGNGYEAAGPVENSAPFSTTASMTTRAPDPASVPAMSAVGSRRRQVVWPQVPWTA